MKLPSNAPATIRIPVSSLATLNGIPLIKSLFEKRVTVKGHTRKDGVLVATHTKNVWVKTKEVNPAVAPVNTTQEATKNVANTSILSGDVGHKNRAVGFKSLIDKINATLTNTHIVGADRFEDLPQSVQDAAKNAGVAPHEFKGVTMPMQADGSRSIFVVHGNHASAKELQSTIVHELYGHIGLRNLFGADITARLNKLYLSVGEERIKKLADKYGVTDAGYFGMAADAARDAPSSKAAKAGGRTELRNAYIAEELLSHIAQKETGTLKQQALELVGAIRNWFRQHGLADFSKLGMTDIAYVLRQSRRAATSPSKGANGVDAPMFSLRKSISLEFHNGNTHIVHAGDWEWRDAHAPTLLKADLAPGERWITVHPNGASGKGVPLMVREAEHGSGTYHVIGGAGGKLNYLKLTGIKPESSYKQEASERAKARTEEKKQQQKRDKELGLDQGKGKAREEVKRQKHQAQKDFIQAVAQKMKWSEADLEPKIPENTTLRAENKLRAKHHTALLRRANEAVELQRQHLIANAQARHEAGFAAIPNEHTPDNQLTTDDLEDSRPTAKSSLGFSAHYAQRAEEKGATKEAIEKEANQAKAHRHALLTDNQRSSIQVRGTVAKQVQAEIANIREPITTDVKATLADAKDAVELIKAQKAMKSVEKASKAANKDIDAASQVKAYNLEVTQASDEDIATDVEQDLRTARTAAFLSAIKNDFSEPEKQLRQHIGAGAYNAINGLAVTGTGAALVDRSVVDVLGIAGAAQVLARRLHADLPQERIEQITSGMEEYHLHHYMQASQSAMDEAKELQSAANEIGLGEASHGEDFEAARELNRRKKDCIEQAHKVLGTALGEMETNAALITALKAGRSNKPLEVPMGKISDADAITQARAIGLEQGDYAIERIAGNAVLTVTPNGLDKLSKPVDIADMQRTHTTLSILNGEQDEDDWLPAGFARRPDLAMSVQPGIAPTLAKPFAPGHDLQQSLRDYIGARTADGDTPADVFADIQSSSFFEKVGSTNEDRARYRNALDAVAPLQIINGKMARAESLTDRFNEYADQHVKTQYGGKISTLNRQNFHPDTVAQEALHRALSAQPAGIAAYKPIGELSNDDQRTLRGYFQKHIAHESPDIAEMRTKLEGMDANEPEKESENMFGESSTNPEYTAWKTQRDGLAQELNNASLTWSKYCDTMGGNENAYAAVQDLIRSNVGEAFHEAYNKLNPAAPIKLGRQVIRGNLNHLDAVDPKAREERQAKERQLIDSLRERVGGQYASGSVSDKLDAAREEREAYAQSQMGFFSSEEESVGSPDNKPPKPLKSDERHTLGHAAERTIAGMMPLVGKNFKPGQPVQLFQPCMSGKDGVMRQRSIKFIEANKRVALCAGTGAGKSAMMLGAYSHLQAQGKVKKGIIIVPSIVQGQMGGEALRFLEPGKFKWHCEPGASFKSRLASYQDPDTHFSVVTHQSFRDDLLKMAAMKTGEAPEEIATRMEGMSRKERADFTKEVLDHHGVNFDFSSVDEGHGLLDRQGKENSRMSNAIGGVTDNTPYTISATADLVKNDASEAASVMEKLEPAKHGDRAAFMRRYGVDTFGAKEALKREMLNSVISYKLDPKGVNAQKQEILVKPSTAQSQALAELDKNIGAVRMARMEGKTDVKAMQAISPAQFKDAPQEQHEAIAKELSASLGIIKGSAVRNILDAHPESAKLDKLVELAHERKGKPGVVFAHSLDAVQQIKARLEAQGHRVSTLTGADSSEDKAAKIRGFNPAQGDRSHDIIVCSDAGATGANLQSGQWLMQYDTPMTAMTHAQRQGRINRVGQKSSNIELLDLVSDHASERTARQRLQDKYALRELMSSPYEAADDTGLAHFINQRNVAQQQSAIV